MDFMDNLADDMEKAKYKEEAERKRQEEWRERKSTQHYIIEVKPGIYLMNYQHTGSHEITSVGFTEAVTLAKKFDSMHDRMFRKLIEYVQGEPYRYKTTISTQPVKREGFRI